jgi:transcriptional regulator with XRE-family HTH domain
MNKPAKSTRLPDLPEHYLILFRENLRRIREYRGMTPHQLSEAVGLPAEEVAAWEAGTKWPNYEAQQLLEKALNASAADLKNPYEGAFGIHRVLDPVKGIIYYESALREDTVVLIGKNDLDEVMAEWNAFAKSVTEDVACTLNKEQASRFIEIMEMLREWADLKKERRPAEPHTATIEDTGELAKLKDLHYKLVEKLLA